VTRIAITSMKMIITSIAKINNRKCKEEPKYNVGPKLELRPFFILLLGFFLGLRVMPISPPPSYPYPSRDIRSYLDIKIPIFLPCPNFV